MRTILASFGGEVARVRVGLGYRLAIVLVAFALLLLPVVYLLLICGVGYFVYWHATHNFTRIASLHNVWVLILGYVGPLVAGFISVLFMIKPLFAPVSRAGAAHVLQPEQETILFAFVARVARAVGAAEPRRIAVSCEVNASAELGRGLSGLFGGQLTLTLGLPLVVGLNARQLAGVLAHELGHFGQGTGMRFSYFVRSINHWFARVVYERDGWDEGLGRACAESGRLAPFFLLIILFVWLTRWVLWMLMIIGHVLSCFLSRHMEYDADRYMARLAGRDTFEEIARRLALWTLSSHITFVQAGQWWIKDRYPDDLPALIVSNADRIPRKLHRHIQKGLNRNRTGMFDTHPCLKDRIANVSREDAEGVFDFDEPATVLLKNYPKLARQVSLKFHQAVFGRRIRRDQLVALSGLEEPA